jgi:Fic family protein
MRLDEEIRDRLQRLSRVRSAAAAARSAIDAWYDVELTYTSNAVEGSTLTRSETALVLEKGLTIGGKPLKDHLDALGHRDALHYVRALATAGEPIREIDIRELHRLVLGRSDPDEAGRYSSHQRLILGSSLVLPSPVELPALMGDFVAFLAAEPAGYETAFEAHYRLVTIHPFSDGNGRTARLLMNLILMRAGIAPLVIGPEDRVTYIEALQARQVGGDEVPWQDFMRHRLIASLDALLAHLERGHAK